MGHEKLKAFECISRWRQATFYWNTHNSDPKHFAGDSTNMKAICYDVS